MLDTLSDLSSALIERAEKAANSIEEQEGDRAEWSQQAMLCANLKPGDHIVVSTTNGEFHNAEVSGDPKIILSPKVQVPISSETFGRESFTREGFPVVGFVTHIPPSRVQVSEEDTKAAMAALAAFSGDSS